MTTASPHHRLDEVKKLVAAGSFSVLKKRALDALIPPRTYDEALQFVADAIQALTGRHFVRSATQNYDIVDVYGININGEGWYIKVCIDDSGPDVVVISFHPPEYPMRTRAGTINPR